MCCSQLILKEAVYDGSECFVLINAQDKVCPV